MHYSHNKTVARTLSDPDSPISLAKLVQTSIMVLAMQLSVSRTDQEYWQY